MVGNCINHIQTDSLLSKNEPHKYDGDHVA